MERIYWHKQSSNQPLYPNLLWSRPQTRNGAGKLLIIGGHEHDFSAIARAHQAAYAAGAGSVLSVMPYAVHKFVGGLAECDFLASNSSGGFAKEAIPELLHHAAWADMIVLPGSNGRNSETTIVFEQLLRQSPTPVTITKDTIELLQHTPDAMLQRNNTTLVLSLSQLQRLGVAARFAHAITFGMTFQQLVDALHAITGQLQSAIVTQHHQRYAVGLNGTVGSSVAEPSTVWQLATAIDVAVWTMQQPSHRFAAIMTALLPPHQKDAS